MSAIMTRHTLPNLINARLDARVLTTTADLVRAKASLTGKGIFRANFKNDVFCNLQQVRNGFQHASRWTVGAGPLDSIWAPGRTTRPTATERFYREGGAAGKMIDLVLSPWCAALGASWGAFFGAFCADAESETHMADTAKARFSLKNLDVNPGVMNGAAMGAATGALFAQTVGRGASSVIRWAVAGLQLLAMGLAVVGLSAYALVHAAMAKQAYQAEQMTYRSAPAAA